MHPSDLGLRILDFRASIRGPHAFLREIELLRPRGPEWATTSEVTASTDFALSSDTPYTGCHQLARDGVAIGMDEDWHALLPVLDRAINSAAVDALASRYVLVHAGAVAYADYGVLLPASPGSGKTTLVAGLLAADFRYLSDEVAVCNPDDWHLLPFPKCLCVKSGGASALAPLYPQLTGQVPRLQVDHETVWYLSPPPQAWPSRPVPLRYVVVPRYVAGGPTELVPIARSAALAAIAAQSFGLADHYADRLGTLVEVLRHVDCYRLTISDLRPAVDALIRMAQG
jgi:hypothetical protein